MRVWHSGSGAVCSPGRHQPTIDDKLWLSRRVITCALLVAPATFEMLFWAMFDALTGAWKASGICRHLGSIELAYRVTLTTGRLPRTSYQIVGDSSVQTAKARHQVIGEDREVMNRVRNLPVSMNHTVGLEAYRCGLGTRHVVQSQEPYNDLRSHPYSAAT